MKWVRGTSKGGTSSELSNRKSNCGAKKCDSRERKNVTRDVLAVALMKISCAKSSDNVCTNSARLLDDAHSRRRTKVYSVLGKSKKTGDTSKYKQNRRQTKTKTETETDKQMLCNATRTLSAQSTQAPKSS